MCTLKLKYTASHTHTILVDGLMGSLTEFVRLRDSTSPVLKFVFSYILCCKAQSVLELLFWALLYQYLARHIINTHKLRQF